MSLETPLAVSAVGGHRWDGREWQPWEGRVRGVDYTIALPEGWERLRGAPLAGLRSLVGTADVALQRAGGGVPLLRILRHAEAAPAERLEPDPEAFAARSLRLGDQRALDLDGAPAVDYTATPIQGGNAVRLLVAAPPGRRHTVVLPLHSGVEAEVVDTLAESWRWCTPALTGLDYAAPVPPGWRVAPAQPAAVPGLGHEWVLTAPEGLGSVQVRRCEQEGETDLPSVAVQLAAALGGAVLGTRERRLGGEPAHDTMVATPAGEHHALLLVRRGVVLHVVVLIAPAGGLDALLAATEPVLSDWTWTEPPQEHPRRDGLARLAERVGGPGRGLRADDEAALVEVLGSA